MPFTSVPHKDFFNSSSTPEAREAMNKALQVVQLKVGDLIKSAVQSAQPFNIYSVEIKSFAKYIGGLLKGYKTELTNYIKVLAFNDYLKIAVDHNLLHKLDDELKFLMQFIQKSDAKSWQPLNIDWADKAGIKETFNTAYEGIQQIIAMPGNNFAKFTAVNNVVTKSTPDYSGLILENFSALYQEYKHLSELEILSKQQDSLYYKDVAKKELSHTEEVEYTEKEQYVVEEKQIVSKPYERVEYYTVQQEDTRPVVRYRNETQYEDQTQLEEVTKYREVTYTEEEEAPIRTAVTGIFTLALSSIVRAATKGSGVFTDTVIKTREEPYTEWEPKIVSVSKVVSVPYEDKETYYKEVQLPKTVTKYEDVEELVPVVKERDVTKVRTVDIYKDLIVREFNEEQYKQDKVALDDKIEQLRAKIAECIQKYPQGAPGTANKKSIISQDKYEESYKDLQSNWQDAEYAAYFAHHPNNILTELEIEIIGHS